MKFAASRSLLHGTVGRGATASARRTSSHASAWSSYAGRQRVAAVLHRREVRRLPREHVEVAGEPRPGVQLAGRGGGPGEHPGVGEVGVLERRARAGSAMTSIDRSGRYSTTSAPTPASAAAAVLAASASRSIPSSAGVALRPAHHHVERQPSSVGDVEVGVGQAAGQVLDAPGPPRQAGEAVQRRDVGHAASLSRRTPRRRPGRSSAPGP